MEALILDENWETTALIDTFESFIWDVRYRGAGDFELYLPAAHPYFKDFKIGYYLMIQESDRLMIIETIEVDTDVEDGDKATITGRSLESILDRRVIWSRTTLTGSFQNGIERLLNENAISPANTRRKIPRLVFKKSLDPRITSLTVDSQFYGEGLYDTINSLCEDADIGYSITPDYETKNLVFELFVGEDRTYDQEDLPWVVFSPKYENLMSTNYIESNVDLRNVALVLGTNVGEDETEYYTTSVGDDLYSGLNRRELFVDSSSTSKNYYDEEAGDDVTISDADYMKLLSASGSEAIAEKKEVASFSGEIVQTSQFVLNEDFFIGDKVQIDNGYGKELQVIVSEIVFTHDINGESVVPTFSAINDEGGI